jgi:hypothetical protein
MDENPYQPPRDLRPGMQQPPPRQSLLGPALAVIAFGGLLVGSQCGGAVNQIGWRPWGYLIAATVGGSIAAFVVLCYMLIRNVIFPTYHD